MKENIVFDYKDNIATCSIQYKDLWFTDMARCHPDDMDFASERTGCYIAETRAVIRVLRYQRDHEIKPTLAAFNHLYSNMRTSKNYNPKSYEVKMIRSQIRVLEKELAAVNNDLAAERKSLKDYLTQKDKLYIKLRAKNQ